MKKVLTKIFLRVFFVLLFCLVAGFAVLQSLGYEYSYKYGFSKTSIIDLRANLGEAKVFLDGELVSETTPFEIHGVSLGEHEIVIEKEGFQLKKIPVELKDGLVTKISAVFLLSKNENILDLDENILTQWEDNPVFLKKGADENLYEILKYDDLLNLEFLRSFSFDAKADFRFYSEDTLAWLNDDLFYFLKSNFLLPKALKLADVDFDSWDFESENELIFLQKDELLTIYDANSFFEPLKKYERVKQYWLQASNLILKKDQTLEIVDLNNLQNLKTWQIASDLNLKSALVFESNVLLWTESGSLKFLDENTLLSIDETVVSVTDIKPNGDILFLKQNGEIEVYNLKSNLRKSVTRFGDNKYKLSWYRDGEHFWLIAKESTRICALVNGFCEEVVANTDSESLYLPANNSLLISRDKKKSLFAINDGSEVQTWWRWR